MKNDQAEGNPEQLLPRDKVPDTEWFMRGQELAKEGKHAEALDFFDMAVQLTPENFPALEGKAKALVVLRRPEALAAIEEAIRVGERQLKIAPDPARKILRSHLGMVWGLKGRTFLKKDAFPEALECFEKSWGYGEEDALMGIKLCRFKVPRSKSPMSQEAQDLYEKARLADKEGRYETALQLYCGILEISPDEAPVWVLKSGLLLRMEKLEECIAAADRAIVIDPTLDRAWSIKGTALVYLERYEEAVFALTCALELNKKLEPAWAYKGVGLGLLGRTEEALACFDEAIKLKPNDGWTWFHKGTALALADRNEEAVQCLEQSVRMGYEEAKKPLETCREQLRRNIEKCPKCGESVPNTSLVCPRCQCAKANSSPDLVAEDGSELDNQASQVPPPQSHITSPDLDFTGLQKLGLLIFGCSFLPALGMNGFLLPLTLTRSGALFWAAVAGAISGLLVCHRAGLEGQIGGMFGGVTAAVLGTIAVYYYTQNREKIWNLELFLVLALAALPGLLVGLIMCKLVSLFRPQNQGQAIPAIKGNERM